MTSSNCVLSRFSYVQLFVTPWTVAHQALLPVGFSRQEYWSGLPCPPPAISTLQSLSGRLGGLVENPNT